MHRSLEVFVLDVSQLMQGPPLENACRAVRVRLLGQASRATVASLQGLACELSSGSCADGGWQERAGGTGLLWHHQCASTAALPPRCTQQWYTALHAHIGTHNPLHAEEEDLTGDIQRFAGVHALVASAKLVVCLAFDTIGVLQTST